MLREIITVRNTLCQQEKKKQVNMPLPSYLGNLPIQIFSVNLE